MAEWFRQLPSKIVEFWKKYTVKQKTIFFSVLAAVIVTLIALVAVLNRTTYVSLATFDNTASTAKAEAILTENNIVHRVSNDALRIEVAEDQVSQARLLLGENGISSDVNDIDNNWLFDNGLTTTDSEKRLKQKIKLESDMENTITSIEGINKARVTINLPDNTNSIYASEQNASVSIMINTSSNFQADKAVQSISEYAKSCVGNDDTTDITIIDNQGNLLFSGSNNSSNVSASILIEQQVEDYYNGKLWNLMVNSGVYDEVAVSSNLAVNLSEEEKLNVEYYSNDEDDTGPKSTHYYYVAENVDGTGGVVGTDENDEEITDYDLLDNANGQSSLTLLKETYETSSTTTKTVEPVGKVDLTNSSMAMYLVKYQIYNEEDMEKEGLLEGTTFTEFKAANSEPSEEINNAELVAMLAQATGMKENKIYIVERVVPVFYPKEKSSVPVQSIISILLALLIGGMLLFVVFKGMKPEEVVEIEPELSVEALLATTKENQSLDDIEFSDKSATRMQIEKFVDENPEAVASLLRNWLNDDWE